MRHNPTLVKAFADSLPKAYGSSFDWTAIAEHATVAARRMPGHAGVGTCFVPRLPGSALCVVAVRTAEVKAVPDALVGNRLAKVVNRVARLLAKLLVADRSRQRV